MMLRNSTTVRNTLRQPNWNSTPDDPVYHASMLRGSSALAAIACLLLISVSRAFGAPPDTVFLEELTWTEVRDLIRSGRTTVIVPTGGTEQNGPFMALGKHNVRVKALSEKIARALGNALVAPVLAYVPEGRLAPP